jgi:hypothetical protein
MVLNRRLPRITARALFPTVPFGDYSASHTDKPNTHRNVPGSRPFNEICGLTSAKTNTAGLSGTIQSGLPDVASGSLDEQAKSGSPPDAPAPALQTRSCNRTKPTSCC